MTTKDNTEEKDYDGSGSYKDAVNNTNVEPKKRISLKELAERSASKIITDNKLREVVIPIDDVEDAVFYYKPLEKSVFLTAQATGDPGKAMDYILTHTLWDNEKGKHGDFWTVEDIDKGILIEWQVLILNEIVNGSGHVLTEEDKDF